MKQSSLSSFLLAYVNNTVLKWQWSTKEGSFMSEMHRTSLLSAPDQFGPVFLHEVSKNEDIELCFQKNLALIGCWIRGERKIIT